MMSLFAVTPQSDAISAIFPNLLYGFLRKLKQKLKHACSMEHSVMQDIADPPTELVYLCGVVRNALTFTNLQFLFITEWDRHR